MESRSHAIAAGLFAIILSAGVVLALWWFSDKREATRELVLVTSSSVNGLNPQATVRTGASWRARWRHRADPGNPRDVLVTVRIRADLPITQGTRARLATQGVTGLAFIALDDNGEKPRPWPAWPADRPLRLAPGPDRRGERRVAADAVPRTRAGRAPAGLANPDNLARIERTLAHLERSSQGLERTLQEAPQTLAAVRQVFSRDNLARISRSLDNLERLSGEAVPLAREGRTLLTRLQTVERTHRHPAGRPAKASPPAPAAAQRAPAGTHDHLAAALRPARRDRQLAAAAAGWAVANPCRPGRGGFPSPPRQPADRHPSPESPFQWPSRVPPAS